METKQKQFVLEFIELYKSKPELWKIKSEDYKNRSLRNNSYSILIEKCKEIEPTADKDFVIKKINNFRTVYRRELKKVKRSLKSGAGADDEYIPSLWYYELLHFLKDQEEPVEGESRGFPSDNEEVDIEKETPIKTKKKSAEDELLQLASNCLKRGDDYAQTVANTWAFEFRQASEDQQLLAKKTIDDTLFEARMGSLTRDSNKIRASQPRSYVSDASPVTSWRSPHATNGLKPSQHNLSSIYQQRSQSRNPKAKLFNIPTKSIRPTTKKHSPSLCIENEYNGSESAMSCDPPSPQLYPICELGVDDLIEDSSYLETDTSNDYSQEIRYFKNTQLENNNMHIANQNNKRTAYPITIHYNTVSDLLQDPDFN